MSPNSDLLPTLPAMSPRFVSSRLSIERSRKGRASTAGRHCRIILTGNFLLRTSSDLPQPVIPARIVEQHPRPGIFPNPVFLVVEIPARQLPLLYRPRGRGRPLQLWHVHTSAGHSSSIDSAESDKIQQPKADGIAGAATPIHRSSAPGGDGSARHLPGRGCTNLRRDRQGLYRGDGGIVERILRFLGKAGAVLVLAAALEAVRLYIRRAV